MKRTKVLILRSLETRATPVAKGYQSLVISSVMVLARHVRLRGCSLAYIFASMLATNNKKLYKKPVLLCLLAQHSAVRSPVLLEDRLTHGLAGAAHLRRFSLQVKSKIHIYKNASNEIKILYLESCRAHHKGVSEP